MSIDAGGDQQTLAGLLRHGLCEGQEPVVGYPQTTEEWNRVLGQANRHGVTPLLFRRFKERGERVRVPLPVWKRLRLAYLASLGCSARRCRELGPALARLRSAGIEVIVLKGGYLAEVVYGDIGLRPMGDVDLMAPRAKLSAAYALLLEMGRIRPPQEESKPQAESEDGSTPDRGLHIDLHSTLDVPGTRSEENLAGLWQRARPARIAGVEVLGLSPEDLLLHLCLHACCRDSLSGGLRPLCDITETIRRFGGELDWTQVAERARAWGDAICWAHTRPGQKRSTCPDSRCGVRAVGPGRD